MKTSSTYHEKITSGLMFIVFYFIMGLYACFSQSFQRITHTGVEGSFGFHGLKTRSNSEADRNQILTKGIAIGFVTGNNLIRARIRPVGIYKSANEKRSFEILESEALLNFYPLEFLRTRKHVLDIYFTSGINVSNFKYKNRNVFLQDNGQQNDLVEFNALDKVTVVSQVTGIGTDYLLPAGFVHVFVELLFSNPLYTSTENSYFLQTRQQAGVTFNFGVRIGSKRNVKMVKNYPG